MILANLSKLVATPASGPNPEQTESRLITMVRAAGLEPARNFFQRILSPPHLELIQELSAQHPATPPLHVNNLTQGLATPLAPSLGER